MSYPHGVTTCLLTVAFYSISVLQWLLNADSTAHSPTQRITRFFTTLHSALRNPSRAVFQFYPSSDDQVHLLTTCAQRAGFGGGVVVDYPNSAKKRKMYLCLMVGSQEIPKGLTGEEIDVDEASGGGGGKGVKNERRRKALENTRGRDLKKKKKGVVDKEWILKKKELYRSRGKEGVPTDSKVGTARWLSNSTHADHAFCSTRLENVARNSKPNSSHTLFTLSSVLRSFDFCMRRRWL